MSTKDFAETLLTELEEALAAYESSTIYIQQDHARLEKARADILQALRVPSPNSEDPTVHDGYFQAAIQGVLAYDGPAAIGIVRRAKEIADEAMKAREVKAC